MSIKKNLMVFVFCCSIFLSSNPLSSYITKDKQGEILKVLNILSYWLDSYFITKTGYSQEEISQYPKINNLSCRAKQKLDRLTTQIQTLKENNNDSVRYYIEKMKGLQGNLLTIQRKIELEARKYYTDEYPNGSLPFEAVNGSPMAMGSVFLGAKQGIDGLQKEESREKKMRKKVPKDVVRYQKKIQRFFDTKYLYKKVS